MRVRFESPQSFETLLADSLTQVRGHGVWHEFPQCYPAACGEGSFRSGEHVLSELGTSGTSGEFVSVMLNLSAALRHCPD